MKIALLSHDLAAGGQQAQFALLAGQLAAAGHQVAMIVLFPGGPFFERLDAERKVHRRLRLVTLYAEHLPAPLGPLQWLGAARRLRRWLDRERPDVVCTSMPATNAVAWMATRSRPSDPVQWQRRLVWGIANTLHVGWKVLAPLRVNVWLSPSVPAVVSNSRSGLAHFRGLGYRCRREVVIPNGFDTERFRPLPDRLAGPAGALRRSWGVPDEAPLVGLVGRVMRLKDHRLFVEAARALLARRPDARFVFVGAVEDAEYAAEVRAAAAPLGDALVWAGLAADMTAVYNALDVLAVTSTSEGLPNVVGEAMACGTPLVTADVGDCAWLLGDAGWVVASRDPEEHAAAWHEALAADRARVGREARQRLIATASAEALRDRHLELFAEVVAAAEAAASDVEGAAATRGA